MVKKNNIVAIDTEFNSNNDLLSIGAVNHEFKIDFFINNKVDKKSYFFHGLAEDFLKENGLKKEDIPKISKSLNNNFNIFIGFDIYKDLKVLDFKNVNQLYLNKRIIDLKCILDLYNKNKKLIFFAENLKIEENFNLSSLKHSSSYDAMITYLIFLKIFEIDYNNDESLYETFINDLTSLTKASFENSFYELDNFLPIFKNTEKLIDQKNITEKEQELRYYIKDDFIYFINKKNKIEYRFPYKYVEEKKLKDFNKEESINKEVYGIKFLEKVIKKDYRQYSSIK